MPTDFSGKYHRSDKHYGFFDGYEPEGERQEAIKQLYIELKQACSGNEYGVVMAAMLSALSELTVKLQATAYIENNDLSLEAAELAITQSVIEAMVMDANVKYYNTLQSIMDTPLHTDMN